ncbi:hypothetical protein PSP20601_05580 [Pandoraea sputorum]|nr:hypothetical protein PSP20601_05580 [Pandoraea sputorum]
MAVAHTVTVIQCELAATARSLGAAQDPISNSQVATKMRDST